MIREEAALEKLGEFKVDLPYNQVPVEELPPLKQVIKLLDDQIVMLTTKYIKMMQNLYKNIVADPQPCFCTNQVSFVKYQKLINGMVKTFDLYKISVELIFT